VAPLSGSVLAPRVSVRHLDVGVIVSHVDAARSPVGDSERFAQRSTGLCWIGHSLGFDRIVLNAAGDVDVQVAIVTLFCRFAADPCPISSPAFFPRADHPGVLGDLRV